MPTITRGDFGGWIVTIEQSVEFLGWKLTFTKDSEFYGVRLPIEIIMDRGITLGAVWQFIENVLNEGVSPEEIIKFLRKRFDPDEEKVEAIFSDLKNGVENGSK
jgi:hypothetical protein